LTNADTDWTDPDTARVVEILRGAQRGPNDPDLDVTIAIARLAEANDESAYSIVLEQLTRDASSN